MFKLLLLTFFLFAAVVGLMWYQMTSALFLDTASSQDNTFSAASEFPSPTSPEPVATGSSTIVINEVSSDGVGAGEWIELFNKSGGVIDVSGWKIVDSTPSAGIDVFPNDIPSIPTGGFAVIVPNTSTVLGSTPSGTIVIQLGSLIGNSGLNDNGETLTLRDSSDVLIDAMNYGNTTTPFPTPPDEPTTGQTLKRSPNGIDTDSAGDWVTTSGNSIGAANP